MSINLVLIKGDTQEDSIFHKSKETTEETDHIIFTKTSYLAMGSVSSTHWFLQ